MSVHILTLPYDAPPLNGNAIQRMRRHKKGKLTAEVRAKAAELAEGLPSYERIRVAIVWIVNTRHRHDEDNVWPTAKPIYDGIGDAGLVPDDTPEFMAKVTPIIAYVPRALQAAGMHVVIEPLSAPSENDRALDALLGQLGIPPEAVS